MHRICRGASRGSKQIAAIFLVFGLLMLAEVAHLSGGGVVAEHKVFLESGVGPNAYNSGFFAKLGCGGVDGEGEDVSEID
jgi:hypothetical protein